uniref:Uncharacterized protein n=1 Tax=Arundo donax TaxID=35708 RepID=A0A0A9E7A5_ARUDO
MVSSLLVACCSISSILDGVFADVHASGLLKRTLLHFSLPVCSSYRCLTKSY